MNKKEPSGLELVAAVVLTPIAIGLDMVVNSYYKLVFGV